MYLELSEKRGHSDEDPVHTEGSQFPGLVRHVNMGVLNQGHGSQSIQAEGDEPLFSIVNNTADAICPPELTFATEDGDISFTFFLQKRVKTSKYVYCVLIVFCIKTLKGERPYWEIPASRTHDPEERMRSACLCCPLSHPFSAPSPACSCLCGAHAPIHP